MPSQCAGGLFKLTSILFRKVTPEVVLFTFPQLGGRCWELEGGSQSDSESEGGDQPSAENSASSGSRSTSLNNPKKTILKSKIRRGRKTRKKRKKREVFLTSFHRYLPRIVFRCWLFFFSSTARENHPKHKVEREKCEATGLCVSTRLQDSPLIHAVQCNGTWTWIITTLKCYDNSVCGAIFPPVW